MSQLEQKMQLTKEASQTVKSYRDSECPYRIICEHYEFPECTDYKACNLWYHGHINDDVKITERRSS